MSASPSRTAIAPRATVGPRSPTRSSERRPRPSSTPAARARSRPCATSAPGWGFSRRRSRRAAGRCSRSTPPRPPSPPRASASPRGRTPRRVSATLPDDLPDGEFDLVVASEILYYLPADALAATLAWLDAALVPGGHLVAVHWSGRGARPPASADTVHDALVARDGLCWLAGHRPRPTASTCWWPGHDPRRAGGRRRGAGRARRGRGLPRRGRRGRRRAPRGRRAPAVQPPAAVEGAVARRARAGRAPARGPGVVRRARRRGARRPRRDARPRRGPVLLDDGEEHPYDACVLATGAEPVRLPVDGADLPNVHLLRSVEDALALRVAARPGASAVVVGSGFIGCEAAASLRARGCDVALVEHGARAPDGPTRRRRSARGWPAGSRRRASTRATTPRSSGITRRDGRCAWRPRRAPARRRPRAARRRGPAARDLARDAGLELSDDDEVVVAATMRTARRAFSRAATAPRAPRARRPAAARRALGRRARPGRIAGRRRRRRGARGRPSPASGRRSASARSSTRRGATASTRSASTSTATAPSPRGTPRDGAASACSRTSATRTTRAGAS